MKGRLLAVVAILGLGVSMGLVACGGDDEGCETNSDCDEVVCPDGTKVTECKSDGACYENRDCPQQSGW